MLSLCVCKRSLNGGVVLSPCVCEYLLLCGVVVRDARVCNLMTGATAARAFFCGDLGRMYDGVFLLPVPLPSLASFRWKRAHADFLSRPRAVEATDWVFLGTRGDDFLESMGTIFDSIECHTSLPPCPFAETSMSALH